MSTEPIRHLQAWNGPPAPGLTDLKPLPAPPGAKRGLVVLLVDGLGAKPSHSMQRLGELRRGGADVRLAAAYPSKTRPALVTYLTGVAPALTGARTNRFKGPHGLDTWLARAKAAGMSTACVGDRLGWLAELAEGACEDHRVTLSDGDFVRAAHRALTGPSQVVVLHWLGVDWQGHEHGGASGQYVAATRDADALVELVAENAGGRPVAVLSDHGHADRGGHGGVEPQVAQAPLVLFGPGVRQGVVTDGSAEDVAPTFALLAGCAIPAASRGKPLWDALEPELRSAALDHATAIAARAGRVEPLVGQDRSWRTILLGLALMAVAWMVGPRWVGCGLLIPAAATVLLIGRGDPLSLSAVDIAGRFVGRIGSYCVVPALLLTVALVRSSPGAAIAARKAIALGVGAAGPWLLAASFAGFRPYPALPEPTAGFLPVLLAIPASIGLFAAALGLPFAAWFDTPKSS